jgi:hypothetical protein
VRKTFHEKKMLLNVTLMSAMRQKLFASWRMIVLGLNLSLQRSLDFPATSATVPLKIRARTDKHQKKLKTAHVFENNLLDLGKLETRVLRSDSWDFSVLIRLSRPRVSTCCVQL